MLLLVFSHALISISSHIERIFFGLLYEAFGDIYLTVCARRENNQWMPSDVMQNQHRAQVEAFSSYNIDVRYDIVNFLFFISTLCIYTYMMVPSTLSMTKCITYKYTSLEQSSGGEKNFLLCNSVGEEREKNQEKVCTKDAQCNNFRDWMQQYTILIFCKTAEGQIMTLFDFCFITAFRVY